MGNIDSQQQQSRFLDNDTVIYWFKEGKFVQRIQNECYGEGKLYQSQRTKQLWVLKQRTFQSRAQLSAFLSLCSAALDGVENQKENEFTIRLYNTLSVQSTYSIESENILSGGAGDDDNLYRLFLAFEYLDTTLLQQIQAMKKRGLRFSEEEIIYLLHCCLQGIAEACIRQQQAAHGFVTPHTIAAAPGLYKLSNVRIMGTAPENTLYETLLHTPNESMCYLAPELLEALAHGTQQPVHDPIASDLFSLGLCALHMARLSSVHEIYCFDTFTLDTALLQQWIDELRSSYSDKLYILLAQLTSSVAQERGDLYEHASDVSQWLQQNSVVYARHMRARKFARARTNTVQNAHSGAILLEDTPSAKAEFQSEEQREDDNQSDYSSQIKNSVLNDTARRSVNPAASSLANKRLQEEKQYTQSGSSRKKNISVTEINSPRLQRHQTLGLEHSPTLHTTQPKTRTEYSPTRAQSTVQVQRYSPADGPHQDKLSSEGRDLQTPHVTVNKRHAQSLPFEMISEEPENNSRVQKRTGKPKIINLSYAERPQSSTFQRKASENLLEENTNEIRFQQPRVQSFTVKKDFKKLNASEQQFNSESREEESQRPLNDSFQQAEEYQQQQQQQQILSVSSSLQEDNQQKKRSEREFSPPARSIQNNLYQHNKNSLQNIYQSNSNIASRDQQFSQYQSISPTIRTQFEETLQAPRVGYDHQQNGRGIPQLTKNSSVPNFLQQQRRISSQTNYDTNQEMFERTKNFQQDSRTLLQSKRQQQFHESALTNPAIDEGQPLFLHQAMHPSFVNSYLDIIESKLEYNSQTQGQKLSSSRLRLRQQQEKIACESPYKIQEVNFNQLRTGQKVQDAPQYDRFSKPEYQRLSTAAQIAQIESRDSKRRLETRHQSLAVNRHVGGVERFQEQLQEVLIPGSDVRPVQRHSNNVHDYQNFVPRHRDTYYTDSSLQSIDSFKIKKSTPIKNQLMVQFDDALHRLDDRLMRYTQQHDKKYSQIEQQRDYINNKTQSRARWAADYIPSQESRRLTYATMHTQPSQLSNNDTQISQKPRIFVRQTGQTATTETTDDQQFTDYSRYLRKPTETNVHTSLKQEVDKVTVPPRHTSPKISLSPKVQSPVHEGFVFNYPFRNLNTISSYQQNVRSATFGKKNNKNLKLD